jgi:polyribonucleotide nucleotidyltransferase
VTVKLLDRDGRGRLRLSMKALVPKPEGMPDEEPRPPRAEGDRPPREDGDRPRRSSGRGGERSRR